MYIDDIDELRRVRQELGPLSNEDLETKGPWGIFCPCEDLRPNQDTNNEINGE